MQKVKSQARSHAWTLEESDKWARYNPFIRHRYQKKRRQGTGTGLTNTTSHVAGNENVDHFDQNPPEESKDLSLTEGSQPQAKGAVNDISNETVAGTTGTTGTSDTLRPNTTRQRKGIKGFFKKNRDQDPDKDLESNSDDSSKYSDKHKFSLWTQIRYSFFNSWLNVLLVFVPVGIALHVVHAAPIAVFVVNFIAIIPLAGTLSYATEEIALRVGETIGGLLNATFGNAVELIVSIIALFQNEFVIVQTSLIGSMLSNLLLVMGMCFFLGGVNRKSQHFNTTVAQTAASLLALAIGALIIPTAFNMFANDESTTNDDAALKNRDAEFSRGTAVCLLLVYICYLVFQLRTHEDIYNAPSKKVGKVNLFKNKDTKKEGEATLGLIQGANNIGGANMHKNVQNGMEAHDDENNAVQEEEKEEPTLTWTMAIFTLLWSTVLVAVCAEFLVDAINEVVDSTGISRVFVGLILLPIVGNAAEHATALTVACKDKMDLAIGVAVGSSMQIALLVLPLIVVIGWIAGKVEMTLNFDPFDIIILFVSVLLVNYLIADGESHWLEGVMLIILYVIIALAAWFFPNREGQE